MKNILMFFSIIFSHSPATAFGKALESLVPDVNTSHQALSKKHPIKQQTIDLGEGESAEGSVLYPDQPALKVEIQWQHAKELRQVVRLTVRGSGITTKPGFKVGMSLKELEALNGGPFRLAGFGWDYAGTVLGWGEGKLGIVKQSGTFFVRLSPGKNVKKMSAWVKQVTGDKEFSSAHPAMQKLNPRIYEIVWEAGPGG